jgi:hypothetical protein
MKVATSSVVADETPNNQTSKKKNLTFFQILFSDLKYPKMHARQFGLKPADMTKKFKLSNKKTN